MYHVLIAAHLLWHLQSKNDAHAARENKEDFEPYLGEDFAQYIVKMERPGTWGDELTLVGFPPIAIFMCFLKMQRPY